MGFVTVKYDFKSNGVSRMTKYPFNYEEKVSESQKNSYMPYLNRMEKIVQNEPKLHWQTFFSNNLRRYRNAYSRSD